MNSNNAAEVMIENDTDIKKYNEDLAKLKKTLAEKEAELAALKISAKAKLDAANTAVTTTEAAYIKNKADY